MAEPIVPHVSRGVAASVSANLVDEQMRGPTAAVASTPPRLPSFLPLLPGATHAMSNIAIGYPFDTMKTRLQLQLHSGMLSCAKDLFHSDGPLAFYRGCAMPLTSLICKRPLEFAAFEWFNKSFSEIHGASFLGGCLAGFIGALMGCPFSVVKIQMQASGRDAYRRTPDAILAVYRSRGVLGFYHGLSASIVMQVPYATMYLGTYGALRERVPKVPWATALAGGTASIITWTTLQPLDTIRTVIQATAVRTRSGVLQSHEREATAWAAQCRRVIQQRGFLGLWAGWGPVALRAFPTSGFSMVAYEWVRSITA